MERLFTQQQFLDFGPCALHAGPPPPPLERIDGKRSAVLRRGVRATCPRCPGVYGMIDAHGDLVYVGKAKSLRARLLSYRNNCSPRYAVGNLPRWPSRTTSR